MSSVNNYSLLCSSPIFIYFLSLFSHSPPCLPTLLCPSLLSHHCTFPKCHQIAQSAKRSQSYHKLSPGNFHKLIIGAVITCVEGGQRSLYGVHHPGVIEWGQQGAVWAHLQHILRRVCAERRNPSGGVIVGVHPSSASLERPKSIQMASGVLSASY